LPKKAGDHSLGREDLCFFASGMYRIQLNVSPE
jgi:hypothetical protein